MNINLRSCSYRYWEYVLPRTCAPIFILRNRNGTDICCTLPPQHFEDRETCTTEENNDNNNNSR